MCIGQDVHGNIKLSLKATLRGPGGSETNDIGEGSAASAKETAKIWAPVWDASSITQEQNSASELSVEKNEVGKTNPSASETPVILIRSVEECDEKEKSINLNHNQTSNGPLPYKNAKKPKLSMQKESKSDAQRAEENKKEGKGNAPLSAKDLKLGTKVNAKVYQIREHGLVLDLGGIRRMYRFELESSFCMFPK
jgi:polyribonucleotide nucleotidyltransferase